MTPSAEQEPVPVTQLRVGDVVAVYRGTWVVADTPLQGKQAERRNSPKLRVVPYNQPDGDVVLLPVTGGMELATLRVDTQTSC